METPAVITHLQLSLIAAAAVAPALSVRRPRQALNTKNSVQWHGHECDHGVEVHRRPSPVVAGATPTPRTGRTTIQSVTAHRQSPIDIARAGGRSWPRSSSPQLGVRCAGWAQAAQQRPCAAGRRGLRDHDAAGGRPTTFGSSTSTRRREHSVDGELFAAEMHIIVHQLRGASGTDYLAVIGIPVQRGRAERLPGQGWAGARRQRQPILATWSHRPWTSSRHSCHNRLSGGVLPLQRLADHAALQPDRETGS